MRIFLDASVFLKLFLDEPGADNAQRILETVESSRALGYVTPMVLEEVLLKLVVARASELLSTKNLWRIREALRVDKRVRQSCAETARRFYEYIEHMLLGGLRVEHVTYDDWRQAMEIFERYGLLPADAIHVAVALRVGAGTIATFDEDFRVVKEVTVIP